MLHIMLGEKPLKGEPGYKMFESGTDLGLVRDGGHNSLHALPAAVGAGYGNLGSWGRGSAGMLWAGLGPVKQVWLYEHPVPPPHLPTPTTQASRALQRFGAGLGPRAGHI